MKHLLPIITFATLAVSCSSVAEQPIYENDNFVWYADRVCQDHCTGRALSAEEIISDYDGGRRWRQRNDIDSFGHYDAPTLLETALCNMAVDELVNNIEADSTLRTGALWEGVWTRDVSYSALLSLAGVVPQYVRRSLECKIDRLGRIVQDTGTGGSWPCSSDRQIWALAAWQIYVVTGDRAWLEECYGVIRRSLEDDFAAVFNPQTGLFCGETSFVDWRDQSYPHWMQPADIYRSEALSTNAVYYGVLRMMSRAASILGFGEDSAAYADRAVNLKKAVNEHFWMEDKGYYGNYLYGRYHIMLSPRSDTLGESLAILMGLADERQAGRILSSMPQSPFGPTIFAPQICDRESYHNNAVWPFVTAFWGRAAAAADNAGAMLYAFAANVRAAALFATNQENMVASTGDIATLLNSPNMLWSLSGFLGTVRHTLLGIEYAEHGVRFAPFVPQPLGGERSLKGFRYRNMTLDIAVRGTGNRIRSFKLDGVECEPFVDASVCGKHKIEMELCGSFRHSKPPVLQPSSAAPATPANLHIEERMLVWEPVDGAVEYEVLRNGDALSAVVRCAYPVEQCGEYAVIAVDAQRTKSFASEPLHVYDGERIVEKHADAHLDRKYGRQFATEVRVPVEGLFAIEWLYSNGNGGITDRNRCSTRTLFVDGEACGVSVFPQRGADDWETSGWSNARIVRLSAGEHLIELQMLPCNENMNIDINTVSLRSLRLTKID